MKRITDIKELRNIQPKQNSDELKSVIENIEEIWHHINDYERKELMNSLFTQIVIDTKDTYRGSKYPREVIIVSAR